MRRCISDWDRPQAVDEIEVIWPDGARERFPGIPANHSSVIRKGTGRGDGV